MTFAVVGATLVGFATVVRAHESAGHAGHSATMMQDGAILIAGGRDDAGASVAEAQVYVIALGEVHPTGRMASPRDRHAATLLPDGRVLVTGGRDGQGDLDSMEIFEPSLGTFLLLPAAMLQARQGHTAVVTEDGRVLIQGGTSGGAPVETAEIFDPADDSVTPAVEGVTLASVATDYPDYYPGDIIVVSGGGWLPGETVTLLFDEEPVQHYPRLLAATADGDGNIVNSEYLVEEHDLGTDFLLTATGGTSGMTAQVRFTDSPKVGSVTVGAQSPSPVPAGGSATYTVTVTRGAGAGSSGAFTASLSVTAGLPAGAGASFSPDPVSFAPSDSSKTSTLTITTADTTATGTAPFTVRAATSASDAKAGSGSLSVKGRCDGQSPGFVCRASAGVCDVADSCVAGSTACPADAKSTAACRASTGACDAAESCSGANTCPADGFQPAATVCRASAGACDAAESCSGSSASCPADGFQPAATVCRASAGVCDAAESCTGSAAACPGDGFQSAATVCRASAGACDAAESCTGSVAACPADGFQSSSTACRASAGVCDQAESCTGSAAACPANGFQPSSTACRASAGDCDVGESCTGSSASCPADNFEPSNFVCRPSMGDCDKDETCTGGAAACPADGFKNGGVCRASAGVCDAAESCTGSAADCPADGFQSNSTVCRASAGVCDVGESCTGSAAACPADGFQSNSTVCRASAGACDVGESCTGGAAACPADGFQSNSTVCRASAGACDVGESCTGSAAACPADAKSTAVCRDSSGPDICDDNEVCDGVSNACPGDDPPDETAPVLSCPADHEVVANASCQGSYSVSATASDNCDTTLAPACDQPSGTLSGANSAVTSSCSVTDQAVNTGSCQTKVTLVDQTKPTAVCNSAEALTSVLGFCHASLDVGPTGSDNCDGSLQFSCSAPSLALDAPGTTTATCSATDDSGNKSADCTSTFTLTDDSDPTVECNTALVKTSSQNDLCEASLPVAPTGNDDCDSTLKFICGRTSLLLTDPGSDSTTCLSEDDSGNTSPDPCSSTLTLVDDTLPTASCNSSTVTTSSQGGECTASLTVKATGLDNCDESLDFSCGKPSLFLPGYGSASTTCTSTDDSNNDSPPCISTLELVDDTAPTVSCPAPQTLECTGDREAHAIVVAQAADNCGTASVGCDPGSGDYSVGSHGVSCTAEDGSQNTSACATSVTVEDTKVPTIACPAGVTAECTGNHQATVSAGTSTASDICGDVTISDPGPAAYPLGSTTVTHSATDEAGLGASCTNAVTVRDTTKPSITCPASVTVECTGGGGATADSGQASASDICGGVNVSEPAPATYALGTTHVTHTATDDAGLATSCTNSVTVADTTKPVFDVGSLAGRTVLGNCSGATVSFVPPTASDTCQQVSVTCPSLPGNSFGDNTITCAATDGSGNSSTVDIVVTVLEPLRVAFRPPLEDDNVADDVQTDADVRNLFKSGQTIPHKTKLHNCAGADVTTAVAVTAKLDVTLRDSGNASSIVEIAEAYNGAGGPGGLMVLTDSQFHYNLATNGFLAGTLNGTKYFRSEVRVSYNSSPAIIVGREDATLESR